MVIQSKLAAVVTAADQARQAVRVVVGDGAVSLGLAVALAQPAGREEGAAASLRLVVAAAAPLILRLLQGQ